MGHAVQASIACGGALSKTAGGAPVNYGARAMPRRAARGRRVVRSGAGLTNRQGARPSLGGMASVPPEPILSAPLAPPATAELAAQWALLHGRAAELALLARIAPETVAEPFVPLAETARGWQLSLAAQGLADIEAMLNAGLAALATLTSRGQDPAAPALALWREFHAARASVLAALQLAPVA
jgi:hypothetical protein